MVESSTATAAIEARRMLDIFASVGARVVDVTWTNEAGKPFCGTVLQLTKRLEPRSIQGNYLHDRITS